MDIEDSMGVERERDPTQVHCTDYHRILLLYVSPFFTLELLNKELGRDEGYDGKDVAMVTRKGRHGSGQEREGRTGRVLFVADV